MVKHHFSKEREAQSHKFTHHQSLEEHEVGNLRHHLSKSDRLSSDFDGRQAMSQPPSPPADESSRGVAFGSTPAPARGAFSGLRNRLFGRDHNEPAKVEEGESSTPPNSSRSQLDLTRTETNSRTIRFAEHATNDSDTAPGPQGTSNYGNNQPGFKKSPGLAMFRTTSIKEDNE